MELPEDYAERVYAGVLGKTIGVYLGRPFEGWPYELIQRRLGDVEYYVHEELGVPLVVTDDDIAGTFTFPRAIADHGGERGGEREPSCAAIGESWLNYLIEHRTILWWGGLGNSTEHTAWLRLKSGIPAPDSGSAALNSEIVAEQIGAQIFIDGWAMLCPGDATRAARLAERAARVSHDGAAVHGAVVLAVMEAMAFVEADLDRLLDTALGHIPADSVIRRLIDDVRGWCARDDDWRESRERLAAEYGYDRYGGNCHMVPNHGLIVLSLLHGGGDFSETLKIVNTSGWDTDCNAGNVGCLMGIRNGLAGIDAGIAKGLDWRGPVADRLYVCTADPTRSVSDCVQEADALVATARRLRGEAHRAPKDGAPFHFTMPGSVQGFTVTAGEGAVANVAGVGSGRTLRLAADGSARFGTPVFAPSREFAEWTEARNNPYPFVASPRVFPGQTLVAQLLEGAGAEARLYAAYYGDDDEPQLAYSEPVAVGAEAELRFVLPATAHPAFEIGIETAGTVHLDALRWEGEPSFTTSRDGASRRRPMAMARRAWVNGLDEFVAVPWVRGLRLVQNSGRGLLVQGNRDWRDLTATADVHADLAHSVGIALRVQGMRRYYALLLHRDGEVRLVKVVGEETVLASCAYPWRFGARHELSLTVHGDELVAAVDGATLLTATDAELASGGMALVLEEGCSTTERVTVAPAA